MLFFILSTIGRVLNKDEERDREIMARIKARDPSALSELYDHYDRLLFGLILSILKKREEAEDILQEVFTTIWQKAELYDLERGSVYTWIISLARNKAIDRLGSKVYKEQKKQSTSLDNEDVYHPLYSDNESPLENTILTDRAERVRNALQQISEKQRMVLQVAYFNGMSQSEISDTHDIPLGTVKNPNAGWNDQIKRDLSERNRIMNKKDKFTELCAGHVLNSLSKEDEREFQRLLEKATEDQLDLLDEMKAASAEMAFLGPDSIPSKSVKENILKTIKEPDSDSSVANTHTMRWYKIAVAASFIFIISTLGLFLYTQSLESDLADRSLTISEQRNTIQRLETEVQRKEELLTILEAREVDLVVMDGLAEVTPNGYGKVVWDKQNGLALLQVANLPSVPSDKDYQLWFIVNGQPVSAGVFAINDPTRDNFFKIEELQSSANDGAFAITMEPKGSVPQPTGDMYLLGNMQ